MLTIKTIKEVEELLVNLTQRREELEALPLEAGLKRDTGELDVQIKLLMWVLNIDPDSFADVLHGGLDCDKCGRTFLACLAQADPDDNVVCEDCQDPLLLIHEALRTDPDSVVEVNDHYTDEDGITHARPILVVLED